MWLVLEFVDKVNSCHYDQCEDEKVVAAGETHSEHISDSSQLAHAALKDWE